MKIKDVKTLEQWIKKRKLGYDFAAKTVFRMTRQNLWNIRNDKVVADWHTLNALAFLYDRGGNA
jgi:hypothetical protein